MRRPPVATLGVALLLLLPAVASAADRYVSTAGDDTSNSCLTAASPCATIGRAVGQAASGDTINIDAGTYSGAGNVGVHIDSAKNLSFTGAGRTQTIIDGGNAARLFLFETWFTVGNTTITADFSDLTLQNGNSDGGGAIKASQEVAFTLNLSRVSVSGNTVSAGEDGGAIQARNGNVAICDSTFTNNTATVGGAITAKRVTIENCPSSPPGTPAATFTGNAVATTGQGGAIHANKVTADNVTFDGNAAPGGDGGAIVISTMSTEATALTLSNATFIHNDASSGGAFRVSSVGDVVVSDTTFDDNDASGYGGAFRTDGGDVTVERSTITGSNAATAAAGAVGPGGSLTVDNSTVNGNRAAMFAGFLASGEIGMANSTVHGNTASTYGLLYSDTAIRLRNVTSSGNPVTSNHFFTVDLEVVNSIIDESGSSVCTWSSTINGGGNVLSSTVGNECDGMASPTPTSRVPAASIRLGSLADNGGPTTTMSIGHGSTALGIGGSPNACPSTDQRGEFRPAADCDAGAFERPSFMLTVSASGPGAGTVTGVPTDSTPGSIECGTACAQEFDQDTPVALTATAAPGSVFTGWAGACSGTSPTCTVAMGEARSAAATFGVAPAAPTPVASAPVTPGPGPTSQTRSTRRPSNKVVVHSTTSTGGALVTRLVVESAGTIVQQGTFVPRRAAATAARPACRATIVAPVAGGYAVTCRLNRAARSQHARGALRLRVRTTFAPLGGGPRSTVRTIRVTR